MGMSECDLGMVGLGVMGRNLVLNMADRGFGIAGFDTDSDKVSQLEGEGSGVKIAGSRSVADFVKLLKKPRRVMMLVPAGAPVDAVIKDVEPYLEPGDLIIDGGNSYYKDTERRSKALAPKNIQFFGMGISGGEKGARLGPSMMPGGHRESYEHVRPIFEAVAAHVNGDPCVTYLGPGSAGHYVKMVHNGIEYGLMQLISETYHLMRGVLGFGDDEIHDTFYQWNRGELDSFLLEISYRIFARVDEKTGRRLIDVILDKAKQKGTGKWAVQDAMDLQVPLPTIAAAVSMRDLSIYKKGRETGAKLLSGPSSEYQGDKRGFVERMKRALLATMMLTYGQGMALLRTASAAYGYGLKLADVARIWRGGCIIRAAMLEDIRMAFESDPHLHNLMLHESFSGTLVKLQEDLRFISMAAIEKGIPTPGMAASLAYFDGHRSTWLPANLIQAQRDYFGAHTYERIDEKGVFHSDWD